jgi:hypothetical protein
MNARLVKGLFDNEESGKLYKNTASYFAEWKDEIDNDAALKTLIAAFPLPDAFTAQVTIRCVGVLIQSTSTDRLLRRD